MIKKHVWIVLLAVWCVGCNFYPQLTCDEILGKDLHELVKQSLSKEERRARLADLYDVAPEQINVSSDDTGFGGMGFNKDNVGISVITLKGTPVIGVLDLYKRPPTADKVIECFGSPQLYRAYYDHGREYRLSFDMYYLDKGIMARTSLVGNSNEPPRLTSETPIQSITLAPGVPPEEMLDQLNAFQGADFQALVKQKVKPWPDSWSGIEIDIDPSIR